EDANTSRDNLRQHRLEDEIVLLADECDLHARIALEKPLESNCGVHTAEAAPKDEDACPTASIHDRFAFLDGGVLVRAEARAAEMACQTRRIGATLQA